ncbi:hypothetical protein BV401_00325 [Streptomyces malaysiensis subsp. malaysiensis]|uniref:Uncharacterized protein n=2 Tax=Streptomyces TaxID=1883 RepID=A0A2J7Z190_STRMQ|nr:hypothetical protein BV401_00325 [Streptomyces autolyticus]PNG94043.1 hypothetical protein SMF913_10068 [Streptomyces malaysiensis]
MAELADRLGIALRSPGVSSFLPRSVALLRVRVRIAGCACSHGAPTAVFCPSESVTWVSWAAGACRPPPL